MTVTAVKTDGEDLRKSNGVALKGQWSQELRWQEAKEEEAGEEIEAVNCFSAFKKVGSEQKERDGLLLEEV